MDEQMEAAARRIDEVMRSLKQAKRKKIPPGALVALNKNMLWPAPEPGLWEEIKKFTKFHFFG